MVQIRDQLFLYTDLRCRLVQRQVSEPSSVGDGSLQAGPGGRATDQLISAGSTLDKDSSDKPAEGLSPIHTKKEEILTEREERKEYV